MAPITAPYYSIGWPYYHRGSDFSYDNSNTSFSAKRILGIALSSILGFFVLLFFCSCIWSYCRSRSNKAKQNATNNNKQRTWWKSHGRKKTTTILPPYGLRVSAAAPEEISQPTYFPQGMAAFTRQPLPPTYCHRNHHNHHHLDSALRDAVGRPQHSIYAPSVNSDATAPPPYSARLASGDIELMPLSGTAATQRLEYSSYHTPLVRECATGPENDGVTAQPGISYLWGGQRHGQISEQKRPGYGIKVRRYMGRL